MSLKSKGIAMERELVHLLWARQFAAVRVAGSGSSQYPSCDVLASNGAQRFAFECKSIQKGMRYIPDKEMDEFLQFSRRYGAEPWIAVRFRAKEWHFLLPEDLKKTPSAWGISLDVIQTRGMLLDELIR